MDQVTEKDVLNHIVNTERVRIKLNPNIDTGYSSIDELIRILKSTGEPLLEAYSKFYNDRRMLDVYRKQADIKMKQTLLQKELDKRKELKGEVRILENIAATDFEKQLFCHGRYYLIEEVVENNVLKLKKYARLDIPKAACMEYREKIEISNMDISYLDSIDFDFVNEKVSIANGADKRTVKIVLDMMDEFGWRG